MGDPLPNRILAVLGTDDLKTSEIFYPVIEEVLGSAECTSNIGQGRELSHTVTYMYNMHTHTHSDTHTHTHTLIHSDTAHTQHWTRSGTITHSDVQHAHTHTHTQ